jgi:hypothetical protein
MSMPTKIYLDGSTPSVRPSTPAEDTYTGVVQEKERAALKRFVAVDAGEAVITIG